MITVPTVLVLGAGASMQFGFPSGNALLRQIIAWHQSGTNPIASFGFPDAEVEDFIAAMYLSGQMSVDAFVEHRQTFLKVAKTAIALQLIQCENIDVLVDPDRPGGPNWYIHLLNQMVGRFEDFATNKLSIITFNYDRSLEQFFFIVLKHRFHEKSDEQIVDAIAAVPIVHVHGHLGKLPWMAKSSGEVRPYLREVTADTLRIAASGIRILPEVEDTTPEFDLARKLLSEAQNIYFLGFGYHATNLRRLGVAKGALTNVKTLTGTARDMTLEQCSYLQQRYPFTDEKIFRGNIYDFMMHSPSFLRITD